VYRFHRVPGVPFVLFAHVDEDRCADRCQGASRSCSTANRVAPARVPTPILR
jgi:hypothetical protein